MSLGKVVNDGVAQVIEDITADLNRVASDRTPWDSGTLQDSGTTQVIRNGSIVKGIVSYKAYNKGFNYAEYTDTKKYNPSAKSLSKGSARSKFARGSLKVGTGYLSDTASKCEKGYVKYFNSTLNNTLKGFGK